ncbi:YegS/Rv2252/BmrU family lipid kinase [Lentzea sp. BCCO 10_0061]|uniref:YegS/Rv2252/BmrU family lipid kinase n=1 Tax=Lentzea sokolovensis TaxID=3095429 RepID=A0ABU4UPK7_9PSEU|nr:YegS/Rv2252/BmrU family lipid kinase [Lentzea sp. BCCO 10_0061]MDX8140746.1 YegS/Rv2252/BmrU family lipid kinase [Lentzea sp. BCCO 10_0061]
MTRAALLVVPASGKGRAARMAGSTAAALRPHVSSLRQLVAHDAEGTLAMAREAVADGVDLLVVLGGDGAAHLGLQAVAGTSTALGIVPAGTGNDLAVAVGSQSVEDVVHGTKKTLDLGRLSTGQWFATVLCAGFDSAVNERANAMRWPAGPRRYDLAIVAELASLKSAPLVVTTEDQTFELDATLVAIGNTPSYGGGIPVCPGADANDGLFDVTVVEHGSRTMLMRMLPTLRTGKHTEHPAVRTFRAREVSLSGGNGWIAYADGERQEALPVSVRTVPGALTVLGR